MGSKGLHAGLVDVSTFQQVQDLLNGKNPATSVRRDKNPDYPLTVFVKCGRCGKSLRGYAAKGSIEWYDCKCHYVSKQARKLHQEFVDFLCRVEPEEQLLSAFFKVIEDVWAQKQAETEAINRRTELDPIQLKKEVDDAELAIVRKDFGSLPREVYEKRWHSLKQAILDRESKRRQTQDEEICLADVRTYSDIVLRTPGLQWLQADGAGKRTLQEAFFPSGLAYSPDSGFVEIRTESSCSLFSLLADFEEEESVLASPRGFEPLLSP